MIHDSGHKLKLFNMDMIDKYSVHLIGLQLKKNLCIFNCHLVTYELFFMNYLHCFVFIPIIMLLRICCVTKGT